MKIVDGYLWPTRQRTPKANLARARAAERNVHVNVLPEAGTITDMECRILSLAMERPIVSLNQLRKEIGGEFKLLHHAWWRLRGEGLLRRTPQGWMPIEEIIAALRASAPEAGK